LLHRTTIAVASSHASVTPEFPIAALRKPLRQSFLNKPTATGLQRRSGLMLIESAYVA
jgi:hypothetical protein